MKNTNQPSNKVLVFLLVVVVVFVMLGLVSLFYWFQYRPARIRSYCASWAREKTPLTEEGNLYADLKNHQTYSAYYEDCLHEKGLE